MSKLPNVCICLFYFQVGWGGGWFEGDSTLLIHYKKKHKKHRQQIQNMNLTLNMKDINKILAKIESYVWGKNCNI
jgi:hypothetical protein